MIYKNSMNGRIKQIAVYLALGVVLRMGTALVIRMLNGHPFELRFALGADLLITTVFVLAVSYPIGFVWIRTQRPYLLTTISAIVAAHLVLLPVYRTGAITSESALLLTLEYLVVAGIASSIAALIPSNRVRTTASQATQ
jgi:hypothetical protein